MNLTSHFTLEEMIDSDTATRLSIEEQFTPSDTVRENLKSLCENVLEPIRSLAEQHDHAPTIITISSGYRCERLNEAIGGAKSSQHIKGQASDTKCSKMDVEQFYQFIKSSGIIFDQCIQEFGRWVHISYTAVGENRNQCLRAIKVDGFTKYIPDNEKIVA